MNLSVHHFWNQALVPYEVLTDVREIEIMIVRKFNRRNGFALVTSLVIE